MSNKSDKASQSHEPAAEEQHDEAAHSGSEAAEEGKTNKYDRGGAHPVVGLYIYTALQFVALLLVVVATPIAFFRLNARWRVRIYPALVGTDGDVCVTAWGMKLGCNSVGYYNRDYVSSFCYRMRVNFKLVEAFLIMTIGFMFLGLMMGAASICQKVGKGATGAIGTFAMLMCIVPWGICAGMYHQKPCCETLGWDTVGKVTNCVGNNTNLLAINEDMPGFKEMGSYAAGFGLMVAAWAIQVIAIVFAFVPF